MLVNVNVLGNPETRKILDQYSNNFSTQSLGSYLVKESKHKLYYKKVAGYWFPLLFEHYPVYSKDGSIFHHPSKVAKMNEKFFQCSISDSDSYYRFDIIVTMGGETI